MGAINKEWHETHRMPRAPKLEDRLKWHLEHARVCGCREIPAKLLADAKKRGLL
jgi:hypothetical protein